MNPEQITTRATIADLRGGKRAAPAAKPKRAAPPKHPKPVRAGASSAKKRG